MAPTSRTWLGCLWVLGLGIALAPPPAQGPAGARGAGRPGYPWPHGASGATVESRFAPPRGFRRLPSPAGSFSAWLRGLPVKPGTPEVHLHDGRLKANQGAHCAILDMDVGREDLQQCADAVIRLRAEFLFSMGCDDSIRFAFTSGDLARWADWRAGMRPAVKGNRVSWGRAAPPDSSYPSFRRYLDVVFSYAGSASLAREVRRIADPSRPEPGDLYIQGGSPGHAVIVLDVVEDSRGQRKFLLAQSYMPAQEVQVLKNPMERESPWYEARRSGPLMTPEWPFEHVDLRRFPKARCTQAGE